ncbi:MAG: cell division protein FtsB [Porticoccaceae bacterium]
MRWLIGVLLVLFLMLQYRLWISEGSYGHKLDLERRVAEQKAENESLQERNRKIAAEVNDLKSGMDSVEERARNDLGMIKQGETFYMVIDQPAPGDSGSGGR